MPRTLSGAVIAELTARSLRPILLAELHFVSSTEYVWTGSGTITWNGHDWTGVPGQLAPMEETDQVTATNLTLTLSGIPSDRVASALTECRHGNNVTVWFGMLDASGVVIADPVRAWSGVMDVPTIDDSGETSTVTLNVESRLARLQVASNKRYTTQDQQPISPGDLGFQYVESIQDWTGAWGKATGAPGGMCSCSAMWLDANRRVADVCREGGRRVLEVLRKDPEFGNLSVEFRPVLAARLARVPCVRVVGANGRAWEGAKDTPFILPSGIRVLAQSMLLRRMLTDGGPGTLLEWTECVAVEDLGECEVVAIDLGGEIYPCGMSPRGRVWTHNKVSSGFPEWLG